MTPENMRKLENELARDEGEVLKVYKDSLGFPTVGIGHLITKDDPEFGKPVGYPITQNRSRELFRKDVQFAITDAIKLVDKFDSLPDNIQRVLVNMTFNMGYTKMLKWVNFRKAINEKNWERMIPSMKSSLWAKQVKSRSTRLIALVQEVIKANNQPPSPT